MMSRFGFAGVALVALVGALAMSPSKAPAVVSGGIKILCDRYEVSKTYHGTLAQRMASGEFQTIRWNVKTDEKTGRILYQNAYLVKATANGYDRSGKVNSVTVTWMVADEWVS